jgi:SH3-like domain-containing protein
MFLVPVLCFAAAAAVRPAQAQTPATQDTPPVIPAGEVPAPPVVKSDSKADAKKAEAAKKKEKAAADKAAKEAKAKEAKAKKQGKAEPAKAGPKLTPGPAVAREKNVNLRGQAAINSEIVTHIKRGELVTVLDEVTLSKPQVDEPARWAKVALPPGTVVWVNTQFVDPKTKAVVPKRLNLRSGPGENYSILGRVDKGYVVKEVETKGDWMKVEAPTNSYAFIAAHLLSTDPADLGPALAKAHPPAPPVVPPPTETVVVAPSAAVPTAAPLTRPAPTPVVFPPPPPPPATVVAPPLPPQVATVVAPTPPPAETPPAEDEPPPKRIVTREGIVKGSASIQAPTYFALRSLDNNKTINYLQAPTNIVMREYQLQRVLVTGEEILDERWPNTPVITIENIQTIP